MKLPPLTGGRILRRYKRFLADIELEDGTVVVAHCANTGAMTGCWEPGAAVQISHSDDPRRKLAWTLERVDMGNGWIGVNTARINAVVAEAVDAGSIGPLRGYRVRRREPPVTYGDFPRSRLDLELEGSGLPTALVEVKNATLPGEGVIRFPDARTARGRKHLEILAAAPDTVRAVLVFALNRPGSDRFEPARDIDPDYAEALERAVESGLEVVLARVEHDDDGYRITRGWRWSGVGG